MLAIGCSLLSDAGAAATRPSWAAPILNVPLEVVEQLLCDLPRADAIVAAVAHREYQALSVEDLGRKMVKGGAFIDVKATFDAASLQGAGFRVWTL